MNGHVTRLLDRHAGRLRTACAALVLVVAAIHLYWGMPRFAAYVSIGRMPDPRPPAFVLSGHAIVLGLTLVALDVVDVRRTYLPGIALMVTHLVGYVAWHTVLGHGAGEATGGDGHAHVHLEPGSWLGVAVEHAVSSPLPLASKAAEIAVLAILALLYVREVRPGLDSE